MARKRNSRSPMKACLQIFKLKFECNQSNYTIAAALRVSPSTGYEVLSRFTAASLSWPLPDALLPEKLEKMLFPTSQNTHPGAYRARLAVYELRRPGVTRQLLWIEYSTETGDMALGYSQFCRCYRQWKKCQKRSMSQTRRAGEKLFIDFCGPTVPVADPDTGKCALSHHLRRCHGSVKLHLCRKACPSLRT